MAVLFWRGARADAQDTMRFVRPAIAPSGSAPADLSAAPEASEKTREERRFNRYDKNRDELVGREEYLASRRKAFARLGANGDGRLSFDEWAAKATDKFAKADADRSASLSRAEFANTAVKRRAAVKANCAPERVEPETEPSS